jgi:putative endonuclease
MARPAAPPSRPDPAAVRRRLLGERGEDLAAAHLVAQGMVLLDRNWRCDAGEIDLVLRDGAVLVVCEVKTRSSTAFGEPLEAVTPVKAARLRRLAVRWVREHDCRPGDIRIDMVGVLAPRGRAVEVEHVEGIG